MDYSRKRRASSYAEDDDQSTASTMELLRSIIGKVAVIQAAFEPGDSDFEDFNQLLQELNKACSKVSSQSEQRGPDGSPKRTASRWDAVTPSNVVPFEVADAPENLPRSLGQTTASQGESRLTSEPGHSQQDANRASATLDRPKTYAYRTGERETLSRIRNRKLMSGFGEEIDRLGLQPWQEERVMRYVFDQFISKLPSPDVLSRDDVVNEDETGARNTYCESVGSWDTILAGTPTEDDDDCDGDIRATDDIENEVPGPSVQHLCSASKWEDSRKGNANPWDCLGRQSPRPHSECGSTPDSAAWDVHFPSAWDPARSPAYSPERTPSADAQKPSSYTVTYWAIVEYGDQVSRIPISSSDVSGPTKRILEDKAGMKQVWSWVQDKGLTDKVSLLDAFDLAMDMESNLVASGFANNSASEARSGVLGREAASSQCSRRSPSLRWGGSFR